MRLLSIFSELFSLKYVFFSISTWKTQTFTLGKMLFSVLHPGECGDLKDRKNQACVATSEQDCDNAIAYLSLPARSNTKIDDNRHYRGCGLEVKLTGTTNYEQKLYYNINNGPLDSTINPMADDGSQKILSICTCAGEYG